MDESEIAVEESVSVVLICACVGVLVLLSFILYMLFKHYTWNGLVLVNCWFCQTDSFVPREKQNKWMCCACDQYNGFNTDGGYNRVVPQQHDERLNPPATPHVRVKREPFCVEGESAVGSNGLCRPCNNNQLLKIKQLATFVPDNEMDYDHELSMYKRRLERVYALCPACDETVAMRLQAVHQQYIGAQTSSFWTQLYSRRQDRGRESSVARSLPPQSVYSTQTQSSTAHTQSGTRYMRTPHKYRCKREQEQRRSVGSVSKTLHWLGAVLLVWVWLADLHQVHVHSAQLDMLVPVLSYVPERVLNGLPWMYGQCSVLLLVLALPAYITAILCCQARVLAVDLTSVLMCAVLGVLHSDYMPVLQYMSVGVEERPFWCLACAMFAIFSAVAACVLNRKPLRTKKNKFSGCFSLASTPHSQCSSQRNQSVLLSPNTPGQSQSPIQPPAPPPSQSTNHRRTRRSPVKDSTPSRELASGLGSLSLGRQANNQTNIRNGTGPFPSLSRHVGSLASSGSSHLHTNGWPAARPSFTAPIPSSPSHYNNCSTEGSRTRLRSNVSGAAQSVFGGQTLIGQKQKAKSTVTRANTDYGQAECQQMGTENDMDYSAHNSSSDDSTLTSISRMRPLIKQRPPAAKWHRAVTVGLVATAVLVVSYYALLWW